MGRYSEAQLQDIAYDAIQARNLGDIRYNQRVMVLSSMTGVHPEQVNAWIERKAEEYIRNI